MGSPITRLVPSLEVPMWSTMPVFPCGAVASLRMNWGPRPWTTLSDKLSFVRRSLLMIMTGPALVSVETSVALLVLLILIVRLESSRQVASGVSDEPLRKVPWFLPPPNELQESMNMASRLLMARCEKLWLCRLLLPLSILMWRVKLWLTVTSSGPVGLESRWQARCRTLPCGMN